MKLYLLLFSFLLLLISCARSEIKSYSESLRLGTSPEELEKFDKQKSQKLREALSQQITFYQKHKKPEWLYFGGKKLEAQTYYQSLAKLLHYLESEKDISKQIAYITQNFDFYEVYGDESWSEVFITGYYLPEIKGSLRKSKTFNYPLYTLPKDLVKINLKSFAQINTRISEAYPEFSEDKFRGGVMIGRKDQEWIQPYFSREEIDENSKHMKSKTKLIAYVDPVDAFFLQIQGSGLIDLNGKKITVGYAGQNGHSYVPIGKFLTEHIPLEEMSMQKIRSHLETLPPEEKRNLLHKNPSYVFFQVLKGKAKTYIGADVNPMTTIATDHHFFPKGALGFLSFRDNTNPDIQFSDFVIDQDTGGAIRGPGRVDLFIGYGPEAGKWAGNLKARGQLWYMAPKELKN